MSILKKYFYSNHMFFVINIILLFSIDGKISENTNECLVSIDEAKKILQEKYKINPDYIEIDENMRFILGKCNPILFVPALYASRLVTSINCPVFKKDFMNYIKMRLFCGNTICADDKDTIEEYVIFPAIFDSPFQIRVTEDVNKFTACQGYFLGYYNSRKECPEENCEYSDGVRISVYGTTKNTVNKSKCGINGQEEVIYVGKIIPTSIINEFTHQNAFVMFNYFRKMGYKEGFSSAGIAYDYRRYIHSCKYFESAFEYEINSLYRNTGKPVVIITASHGGSFALNELIKASPELKKKIKCFVPIVPPFAGSSHLLLAYLYGLPDFNTKINILDLFKIKIELTYFSESLYFNSAPVIAELRPQYGIITALQKPEYHKFKLAIEELIAIEKECGDINCPSETVRSMTKNYLDIYGDDFPSLDDEDCQLDEQDILKYNQNKKLGKTYTRRCVTNLYDIIKCPIIVYEKDFSHNVTADDMKYLCGIYNSSLLYLIKNDTCESPNYKDIFGNNMKKEEEKISLDTVFDGNAKYPYNYPNFSYLLEEYNKNFAKKYNKTLTKDDFDTEEEFQKKGKRNVEYTEKSSLIKDLPIPPVDTYVIYANYYVTETAYVYDNINKNKTMFDKDEILSAGGDGTVPNFSSFLTGMKWLYDKKMNNLTQNIKLIEYCSLLGKEGNKYAYNHTTFKNKTFIGLACDCIKPDYKSYSGDCTHTSSLKDSFLLDMIKNEIIYDENNGDFNENVKKAIKSYNKSIDYEQICNNALYYFNKEDMDPIDWF